MNTIRLVAVFAENKPGQTAKVTRVLADAGINIRWATIASSGSFGVLKFVVDNCDLACQRLRDKGLMVSTLRALAVQAPDRPGALSAVAETLAAHQINLDNTSGFVVNNQAILIIETHDLERAAAALEQKGWRLLSETELLGA
ncbi:MAG: ACT domain-containing protein [Verrucomicrobiae bacterium]|nr:ACT domain-containing protein [Verrucomicrobiae bacterium]